MRRPFGRPMPAARRIGTRFFDRALGASALTSNARIVPGGTSATLAIDSMRLNLPAQSMTAHRYDGAVESWDGFARAEPEIAAKGIALLDQRGDGEGLL